MGLLTLLCEELKSLPLFELCLPYFHCPSELFLSPLAAPLHHILPPLLCLPPDEGELVGPTGLGLHRPYQIPKALCQCLGCHVDGMGWLHFLHLQHHHHLTFLAPRVVVHLRTQESLLDQQTVPLLTVVLRQ